jgi:hypothetical protein
MRSYFFSFDHLLLLPPILHFLFTVGTDGPCSQVQMVLVVNHKISWFHNVETAILIFEVLMDYLSSRQLIY